MFYPLNLIRRERLCDGDLVEKVKLAEVAEHWLWGLNEVNEHRLKAIPMEVMEGVLWAIIREGMVRNSHYVHLPLLLVTNL